MTNPSLNTLFYFCNDVEKMRFFYIELLGCHETYYRNDDHAGWLTFELSGINVVFIRGGRQHPVPEGFALQPGYSSGTLEQHSWVIEYPPLEFEAVVIRMQAARVPSMTPSPEESQPGQRMFVVRDPMGSTVELYTATA